MRIVAVRFLLIKSDFLNDAVGFLDVQVIFPVLHQLGQGRLMLDIELEGRIDQVSLVKFGSDTVQLRAVFTIRENHIRHNGGSQ